MKADQAPLFFFVLMWPFVSALLTCEVGGAGKAVVFAVNDTEPGNRVAFKQEAFLLLSPTPTQG